MLNWEGPWHHAEVSGGPAGEVGLWRGLSGAKGGHGQAVVGDPQPGQWLLHCSAWEAM